MKKALLTTALFSTLLAFGATAQAAEAPADTTVPTESKTRTLIPTAKGTLEGQLVQHIKGVPNSGRVTLHYKSSATGFVDGDISYLTIMLPQEFKYIGVQPDFNQYVTGQVKASGPFKDRIISLNDTNVKTYSDRVIITNPRSLWVGIGSIEADIVLDYGAFLDKYPSLPIPENANGYQFISALKYSSSPWDLIKDPIFGTFGGSWTTRENSAIL